MNLRFSRIPSTRDSNSWLTATVNPSWVSGIGRTFAPGGANCSTPGCSQVPAVASGFAAGYADSWLNILGVLSQANLSANYDREGNILPVGQAISREYASDEYDFYVQDSWRVGSSLTITAGLRYGLYSPPYEVNGLQVAPTISMGQWFADRAAGMLRGVPSNQSPLVTFDLAGPKNGGKGFYEWDKNNFAPRVSVAWSPHAESGFLGTLTGGDRMVIRGGYSKVFDRIGQGLALNFDSRLRVRHVDGHQQPVRLAVRAESGGPVRQHVDAAADVADAAARRVPADAAAAGRHHHDRASTTRSSRRRRTWSTRSSRASWRAASRSRAATSAASGAICWFGATSRCR